MRLSHSACFAPLLAIVAATPAAAQGLRLDTIPVATIDFYGLRTVPDNVVRGALGITPGVPIPDSAGRAAATARVESVQGVRRVRLNAVCCADSGGVMLYVGVEETGASTLHFVPEPTGSVRLPATVIAAGEEFGRAFSEAVAHGDFAESDTAGHAIMHWPPARAVQLHFVDLSVQYTAVLRSVLHTSADPEQRALAAQILGYVPDKATIVADLAAALHDPDGSVRNNASRALWLIAMLAQRRPELGLQVPYDPLIEMLDSPVWTDRNKASLALMQLTENRDSALIAAIRDRSVPALLEMARWQNMGHARAALMILGRLADLTEAEISEALQGGNRETILEAAERIASSTPDLPDGPPQFHSSSR